MEVTVLWAQCHSAGLSFPSYRTLLYLEKILSTSRGLYLYKCTDFRSAFAMAARESSKPYEVHTAVTCVKRTAFWTIEQFPSLTESYRNSDSVLKSPEFEIKFISSDSKLMSTKWNFECYPGGEFSRKYYRDYVSLYLRLSEQTPCPVDTKVAGILSLGTGVWHSPYEDINSSHRFGQHHVCSHDDLTAHPENYLIDDKLCIKCEMSFMLVGGSRLYAGNSLTDFNPLRLKRAEINATAWDRQAWQDLKANTVVDLGPSLVTIAFGDEGTEEVCHTFPLAARSPVFRKMLTVDMLEKASGRVELPHISPATGKQCSEFVWFRIE
jgi:hypothetical protein